MKLSETRKTRSATVEVSEGLSFTFTYKSFSPDEWDTIDTDSKKEKWGVVTELSKLLVTTGLEDDSDQPIAPTIENLRKIETPILQAMLSAVLNTTLPKKAN